MSNMDHFSSRKKVDDIFKEDKGRSVIPLCNQARDYVEVFSAQGKDPAQNWAFRKLMPLGTEIDPREAARIEAAREQKGMVRVYAPEVKGYYVRLTQQASLPKAPLKLELIQPYVVFQTFVPSAGNGFRVRLEVSTERGAEKTLFLSSGLKTSLLTNPERKCLPLPVQSDVWLNLVVDLADLVQNLFPGDKFYALKGIELESSCRIRRIFTVLKKPTADTFAPRDGDQAGDAVVVGRVRSSTQGWSALGAG
ncbi:hypothetical protein T484DRAFT_3260090 [Baffinella frigidus]|nr:hypothetical protein T484DRAFT_3260090 [Cryptophyta sp. CCMP2293]